MIFFFYFSSKPYVETPHLNRLIETVQIKGQKIWSYVELTKIIPKYHQILPLIYTYRALKDTLRYQCSSYCELPVCCGPLKIRLKNNPET